VDTDIGLVRGPEAWRAIVPDFEFDLGLTTQIELDISGAYAIEGEPGNELHFDHSAPDPLWVAAKLGLFDDGVDDDTDDWAIGIELGPKLPVVSAMHGVGYEALLIGFRKVDRTTVSVSLGGVYDPGDAIAHNRPVGAEGGMTVELDLDKKGV